MNSNSKLILASTSPFRKALLERTLIDFSAKKPDCDEEALKKDFNGSPQKLCSFLAEHKASSLISQHPEALIVGSDQALFLGDKAFDKPLSLEKGTEQLKELSGKTAELITAVCLKTSHKTVNFENVTKLYFKDLTEEQIVNYLKVDQPFQCAGSFMFEKKGIFLFEKIECSDPSSIEGLPLMKLVIELEKFDIHLPFISNTTSTAAY